MGGGAISMVLKNQTLFVARLSGKRLRDILLDRPKKKIFPAETKNRGNEWAGPPNHTTQASGHYACAEDGYIKFPHLPIIDGDI
jgi:hypothetical protein